MTIEQLIEKIRIEQETMTDDERLELWSKIMHGYCKHCGIEDPKRNCQCWNDE